MNASDGGKGAAFWGTVIAAVIGAVGAVTVALIETAGGEGSSAASPTTGSVNSSPSPATAVPPTTGPLPTAPTSAPPSGAEPTSVADQPTWSITPADYVPVGGMWEFQGSGFKPFEYVELRIRAFGSPLGNDQADAAGHVEYRPAVPVQPGDCRNSPIVVDVVRGQPELGDDGVLGSATIRLCSP